MAIAIDSPTLQVARDEQVLEGTSNGLAVLFAELMSPGASIDLSVGTSEANCHSQVIAQVIREYQGQVIRVMGSSIMVEFSKPLAAVRAAIVMERLLAEAMPANAQNDQLALRIGIHAIAGQCEEIDVFSKLVHVAANITKYASAGHILVSRETCDAVSVEKDLHFQWSQKVSIQGLKENEDIFELHWAPAAAVIPSRYEAMFQVGTGGMGIVYKVRDKETEEIVALKVLRSEIATDPAMKENLKREVCLARKVTHKNVCRIHEFNRSNGVAYISMEFVEGESLLSALQRSGPMEWNDTLKIVRQICAGLGEAHAQGIVHRDLKPANIMMDRAGVVKIMDFGIARPFQGTGQMTGTLIGTPAYMAPEQVELKRVDARTDVYALGLLLYEIVTGAPAFNGDTPIAVALKQLRESPELPREIAAKLPPQAEAIILKCLQKDPNKRFQSTEELAAALRTHRPAKPQVSTWNSYFADLQNSLADLRRSFPTWQRSAIVICQGGLRRLEVLCQPVVRYNWKSFIAKRNRKELAIGLALIALIGGILFFTLRTPKPALAVASAPPSAALPEVTHNASLPASASPAADNGSEGPTLASAVLPINGYEVDLGSGAGFVSKDISVPDRKVASIRTPLADDRSNRNERTRPAGRAVATKTVKAAPVAQLPQATPTVASPVVPAHSEISNEQQPEISSALADSVLPIVTSAADVEATKEKEVVGGNQSQNSHFFEVGSFKDPTWADHAVEKLTQLGFQATSVRKNVLWVRSYQVRVGPYADAKALEVARLNLIAQGFKPHPVK